MFASAIARLKPRTGRSLSRFARPTVILVKKASSARSKFRSKVAKILPSITYIEEIHFAVSVASGCTLLSTKAAFRFIPQSGREAIERPANRTEAIELLG